MRLFILLSRFPFPLEKGDKLRAYHQIKELHTQGFEIHLCCLTDQLVSDTSMDAVKQFCAEVHVFKLNQALIYWNTAKQIFTGNPFQVGYFYQKSIARKISQIIDEIKPQHIYCQLIRTTEYVKNIHDIPKTLDYMDALSKGMLRRAQISSGIKQRIFEIEGKRLREYENRIFDYFNFHTIISEQDKELISHPTADKIEIIENGISYDFFDYSEKTPAEYDIVFVGNMNYAPNIECAEYLVNDILPLLAEDTKVALCGASPHQRIIHLANNKNVTVTGWVDDIKSAYSSGRIFVAPLFIGTGLQNKLLEAMALGLPCITTPLANNALKATSGEEIMIASTAEEFADSINKLLGDRQLYNQIALSAKSFVQKNFSWKKSVHKLSEFAFKGKQ
jgi:sugar transferase (PEP-CTERM/EpsH1 system associated)